MSSIRRRTRSMSPNSGLATGRPCPEYRLLIAMIKLALRDAAGNNPRRSADALAYLHGPNFRADCECLNIDPDWASMSLRRNSGMGCAPTLPACVSGRQHE